MEKDIKLSNHFALGIRTEYSDNFKDKRVALDEKFVEKYINLFGDTIVVNDYYSINFFPTLSKLCQEYNKKAVYGIEIDYYNLNESKGCSARIYAKSQKGLLNINLLLNYINKYNKNQNVTDRDLRKINRESLQDLEICFEYIRSNCYIYPLNSTVYVSKLSELNANDLEIFQDKKLKVIFLQDNYYENKQDFDLYKLYCNKSSKKDIQKNKGKYVKSINSIVKECKRQDIIEYFYTHIESQTNKLFNDIPRIELFKNQHGDKGVTAPSVVSLNKLLKAWCKKNNTIYKNSLLENEFKLVAEKGMANYFLFAKAIVDIIKEKGLLMSSGRGSSVASLICYALGITRINPKEYRLSNSSFLTAIKRDKIVDIDIDIEQFKQKELIVDFANQETNTQGLFFIENRFRSASSLLFYLREKHNITYEYPENKPTLGNFFSSAEGKELLKKYPDAVNSFYFYGRLNYVAKQTISLVFNPSGLMNFGFFLNSSDFCLTNKNISFYDIFKVDILPLQILTNFKDVMKKMDKEQISKIFEKNPFNESKIFSDLNKGLTKDIHLLNAEYTHRILIDHGIKENTNIINNFTDLINFIAVTRPFFSKHLKDYLARKTNTPINKEIQEITKLTQGYVIFQDQAFELAKRLGYDEKDVYSLSKMSKENFDVLFCDKVDTKIFNENERKEVYEVLSSLTKYGYSKAHATAYGDLIYRSLLIRQIKKEQIKNEKAIA